MIWEGTVSGRLCVHGRDDRDNQGRPRPGRSTFRHGRNGGGERPRGQGTPAPGAHSTPAATLVRNPSDRDQLLDVLADPQRRAGAEGGGAAQRGLALED